MRAAIGHRFPLHNLFTRFSAKLTARRVQIQATVLLLCTLTLYGIDIATPGLRDRVGHLKGPDFLQFYIAGSLANQNRGDALYDPAANVREAVRIVPEGEGVVYFPFYGPQVSLFFAPFARLPYGYALLVWTSLSAAIYAACCFGIWSHCYGLKPHGRAILLLAIAYPAFFALLTHGQISALALAWFTLAYLALERGWEFAAGMSMGLLLFKPQLGFIAAACFLFCRRWKVVAAALISIAVQVAIVWIYYGLAVIVNYCSMFGQFDKLRPFLDVKLYQNHSLRSFWTLLVPQHLATMLYILCAAAFLVIAVLAWRTAAPLSLRYSILLLVTVLVSPHLYVYDLVILAPALMLVGDWALQHSQDELSPEILTLLYMSFVLPLLGPITRFTHLQLSVIAFALLTVVLFRVVSRSAVKEEVI